MGGLYLPSVGTSPAEWLPVYGTEMVEIPSFHIVGASAIAVVLLVDGYTGAAVMYSARELRRWNDPADVRRKRWFYVSLSRVRELLPELDSWIAGDGVHPIAALRGWSKEEKVSKARNRTGAMVTHIGTVRLGEVWDTVKKYEARSGNTVHEDGKDYLVVWHAVGRRAMLCEILNPSGSRCSLGIAHRGRNCERCGHGGDKPNEALGKHLSLWRAIKNLTEGGS